MFIEQVTGTGASSTRGDHNTRIFCGLYYKHITIVNDDSSVISMCYSSLIDDARGIIYDCNLFMIQATSVRRACVESIVRKHR
jgi:hypothetical protein